MDYEPLISKILSPEHKLIVAVEAGLVKEFIRTSCIVALIEGYEPAPVPATAVLVDLSPPATKKSTSRIQSPEVERAVLVLCCNRRGPSPSDVAVEAVLPVDARFTYSIDGQSAKSKCPPSSAHSGGSSEAVLLSLSSLRHKLLFEMAFGQRTNTFVAEVLKAAEGVSKRKAPTPEFTWLKPYLAGSSSSSGGNGNNRKSPSDNSSTGTTEQNCEKIFTIDKRSHQPGGSAHQRSNDGSNRRVPASPVAGEEGAGVGTKPGAGGALTPDDISVLKIDSANIGSDAPDRSQFYNSMPTPIAARESHVRHQMSLRESSYTHNTSLTVFVGTWNVNGVPPSIGLAEWLAVDQEPPDVYALGFQELDLATETYIFNATPKENEWRAAVAAGVHPAARYKEVSCVRLVGMLLLVLVQDKHVRHVAGIHTCTVPTGLMNVLGNKGGVSTRLELYNTSVCFVNCHLAAHVEEYERRNEDYDGICEKTVLGVTHGNTPRYIRDHSHIYFFGDMNYRIPPNGLDVRHLASTNQFKTLLSLDQLNIQRRIGRVFKGYHEGSISFRPTFKYDLNTDGWDSSEKARQPAWCDRILWAGEGIAQTVYRSHMALKISDHKPVSAIFQAQIKVIDVASYRRIHEEVMKQLDKLENEYLPQVSLSVTEIILEPVKFLQPQQAQLQISNTGQVPVQFSFIKKLNDETCCKPWLKIHPLSGFIIPGADCTISLEVKVDKRSACHLNNASEKLYDILVLHLDGGKDFFITITGDYERSCFGSSINALVHMNKPVSQVPVAQLIDLESSDPKNQLELPYAIPKELWHLVDHLHTHGQQKEGLFCRAGLNKEILDIRACLDAGAPTRELPGSLHSVAEALLMWLEALPEPVVPFVLYMQALHAATQGLKACKLVLDQMPDYHRNVFNYLVAFLKELLVHKEQNKLDATNLAMVFGLLLLREPANGRTLPSSSKSEDTDKKKQAFVHQFLLNEY